MLSYKEILELLLAKFRKIDNNGNSRILKHADYHEEIFDCMWSLKNYETLAVLTQTQCMDGSLYAWGR